MLVREVEVVPNSIANLQMMILCEMLTANVTKRGKKNIRDTILSNGDLLECCSNTGHLCYALGTFGTAISF